MSLSALNSPKHRLYMALENAATDAHPGYHVVDDEEGIHEVDAGTPSGKALVKWFKETHPRDAERIERDFVKEMIED